MIDHDKIEGIKSRATPEPEGRLRRSSLGGHDDGEEAGPEGHDPPRIGSPWKVMMMDTQGLTV